MLAFACCCAIAVSCAAAEYKKSTAITPQGSVPDLAKLQREVAANYGPDYARKAVAFMRVLEDTKEMVRLPKWKQVKVEFDVLYALQSEEHSRVRVLRRYLNAQGSQQGSAPLLRSGVDHYKLRLRVSRPCYVYAFQVDSTGKIDPFFPNEAILPGGRNPVQPARVYELPPGRNWAYLDQSTGIEKFYLLVSQERKAPIEELSQYFADASAKIVKRQWNWRVDEKNEAGRPKTEVIEVPDLLAEVNEVTVYTRGFGGMTAGPKQYAKPQYGLGQELAFEPTVYTAGYNEFVQTLWFKHVK